MYAFRKAMLFFLSMLTLFCTIDGIIAYQKVQYAISPFLDA